MIRVKLIIGGLVLFATCKIKVLLRRSLIKCESARSITLKLSPSIEQASST